MRTGGFPCRLVGCLETFQVLDQRSMASLQAASAERTAHEIAAHDYRHVRLADERAFHPMTRTNQQKRPGGA